MTSIYYQIYNAAYKSGEIARITGNVMPVESTECLISYEWLLCGTDYNAALYIQDIGFQDGWLELPARSSISIDYEIDADFNVNFWG